LAAAALCVLGDERSDVEIRAASSADPWSPWNQRTAWRMNSAGFQDLLFQHGESKIALRVFPQPDGGFHVSIGGTEMRLRGAEDAVWIDGVKTRATVIRRGDKLSVIADGTTHELRLIDPLAPRGEEEESAGSLTAPMPGRIVQVLTEAGADVKRGAGLLVLEAMKMEYTIAAPADGRVEQVRYATGDVVDEGAELIAFTPSAES
jgi:3-methylcrotonyl-CoA carboxylase alpha subunit